MNNPDWFDGKHINENIFCDEYIAERKIVYCGSKFYTPDGEVPEYTVIGEISEKLKPFVACNRATRAESILKALKIDCRVESLSMCENEIPLMNGTLKTDGTFTAEKKIVPYRLNIEYSDAMRIPLNYPYFFTKYLFDLLEPEDINTLQEYLGYCLIPSTKAQAAMFIVGSGGEGKSRIGIVTKEIFGNAWLSGGFQNVEKNKFFAYNMQNKLIMVDDDMQMKALSSTGNIKTLITAEAPISIEAKGKQAEQAILYTRFLCFSNDSPKALYDKSDGFTRRLILLKTKPIPQGRVNDPNLVDKFIAEKDKIFNWMFDGLKRLINQNFVFSVSDKARQNIEELKSESCNIPDFLNDKSYVAFEEDTSTSSKQLYAIYTHWCSSNLAIELNQQTFSSWLYQNAHLYGLRHTTHVPAGPNREVRGYVGIKIVPTVSIIL